MPRLLDSVNTGDMIELKDFQTLSDHEEQFIYSVTQKTRIFSGETPLFQLLTLTCADKTYYLSIDENGDNIDSYHLYYSPFPELTRKNWLAEGGCWLFSPPENEENFKPADLELATYPNTPELEELGVMLHINYQLVGEAFYAEEHSEKSKPVPIMLAQYRSEEKVLNQHMLLIERSWCNEQGKVYNNGGILTLLVGAVLAENELLYHPLKQKTSLDKKSWWQRFRER